jgi:hypothetical protein
VPNFNYFIISKVGVVGYVTIRADHQVPGVIRIQIQDGINQIASSYNKVFIGAKVRSYTKWAISTRVCVLWLTFTAQILHSMRRPKSIPRFSHN